MIDWQIELDGNRPNGWNNDADDCCFPDFDHQAYLLPYFDLAEEPLDEYGKTTFDSRAILRLKKRLSGMRYVWESKPERWHITEFTDQAKTIHLQRAAILDVVDKTLEMIDHALDINGQLVFFGD